LFTAPILCLFCLLYFCLYNLIYLTLHWPFLINVRQCSLFIKKFVYSCHTVQAGLLNVDRIETLDFPFDMLNVLDVTQCKLYASEHSSVIHFYENKHVEHVLRLNNSFIYEKNSAHGIWTCVIKFAVKRLYHWATYIIIELDWY